MNPFLNIAIRAARKAGDIIVKGYFNQSEIHTEQKGLNDFVTNIDRQSEKAIIKILKTAYPSHSIIGEESGHLLSTDNEFQWIIDPLDGTTNFTKKFPHFCVSIALQHKKNTVVGVVYDPMRNELFTAVKGEGAKIDDFRLRVNNEMKSLKGAVLATGFPFKNIQDRPLHLQMISALLNNGVADFRRTGSAALDLVYVASNRIDGFFEIGLKPWDSAAGELIAREAGALVTNFAGGTEYLKSGNIICANPKIIKELLNTIKPILPKEFLK